MRGTHPDGAAHKRIHRFIPAGAGNTGQTSWTGAKHAVYPRRCGEHGPSVPGAPTDLRFIPAGAGNTHRSSWTGSRDAVYPRRCGEHGLEPEAVCRGLGLSPQVRGTLHLDQDRADKMRFIPAGAGNTTMPSGRRNPKPVYPRRCGEHSKCRWLFLLKKIQVEKSTNHLDQ